MSVAAAAEAPRQRSQGSRQAGAHGSEARCTQGSPTRRGGAVRAGFMACKESVRWPDTLQSIPRTFTAPPRRVGAPALGAPGLASAQPAASPGPAAWGLRLLLLLQM